MKTAQMKALVLAGGSGSRLRPITYTSAKQLIPVANKPILFYGLEAIAATGIVEVGIVVGDTHADIEAAVGDGSAFGLNVTYLPQEAPLGLAHAVKISEEFMDGASFVMYLGDNLIKGGISTLVSDFSSSGCNSQILLARVPHPERFGVAELSDGRVVRLAEKPAEPKSDLALVGVYMFDATIFKAVNAIEPSPRGELEITDAIQYLVENDYDVRPHIVEGWWKDTGTLEDLLQANRIMLEDIEPFNEGAVDSHSSVEGRVSIGAGAVIESSVIRGPAVIGPGAVIRHAYIGPFSAIGPGVTVEESEIEETIVLEGALIRDVQRIVDSLIGRNVRFQRIDRRPSAYKVMLGDNSEVGVF